MKTNILAIRGTWQDVVDDCRATVGKEALGHEPTSAFKRAILMAEHSPIRDIVIRWKWSRIKSWVATHFSRHKFEKFIRTQRSDRTGTDRDGARQDALVDFVGSANAQQLLDAWRKRLCVGQVSPETREYAEDLKLVLHETEPELSDALVPPCVYRCGCPEMNSCGYFVSIYNRDSNVSSCNLHARYAAYNDLFWLDREGGTDGERA